MLIVYLETTSLRIGWAESCSISPNQNMMERKPMSRCLTLVCAIALVSGCTAVSVQPVADSQELRLVCIIENPKVVVRDFVGVVERRFGEHGIGTKVVSDGSDCEHTLEYTAERSWDLKAFLDYALLTLRKDGVSIGSAEYRNCLLYTSPSPRDQRGSRMPSSA